MLLQHADGLSKHSRKTRERKNQGSELLQGAIGTLITLATQESTILTHTTQGRCPFFAT